MVIYCLIACFWNSMQVGWRKILGLPIVRICYLSSLVLDLDNSGWWLYLDCFQVVCIKLSHSVLKKKIKFIIRNNWSRDTTANMQSLFKQADRSDAWRKMQWFCFLVRSYLMRTLTSWKWLVCCHTVWVHWSVFCSFFIVEGFLCFVSVFVIVSNYLF